MIKVWLTVQELSKEGIVGKKYMSTLKLHTQHQETYESNLIFQRIRMKSTECEPAWCSGPLKR